MPADETPPPDAMHFKSLLLKNVRAFGTAQSLEFANDWNLILGDNGVGKTTLIQALAVMWPTPTYASPADTNPTLFMPRLSEHENNDDIAHFIRRGGPGEATMTAILTTDAGGDVEVGVTIIPSMKWEDPLKEVIWLDDRNVSLGGGGPLVIGYGAARHVGRDNLEDVNKREATESLFGQAIDLYDAEMLLEKLHYAALSDKDPLNGPGKRRLDAVKSVVASLLPGGLDADDILVQGPRNLGRPPDESGVHVRTPSGFTSFADLSLGYQTMFALTVDLAWRLFNAFPASDNPLGESAIVLIDEVDLHMHPQWQRDLRRQMLEHFPKVQFIATTHSPITAQETLSEGGNVAVVRWADGEAHILNNPIPRLYWRYDQLLTSELFEFGSDRSAEAEKKLHERVELIRNPNRSPDQDKRLRELDEFVASLPTARSPSAQSFEELMMNFARDLPSGVPR